MLDFESSFTVKPKAKIKASAKAKAPGKTKASAKVKAAGHVAAKKPTPKPTPLARAVAVHLVTPKVPRLAGKARVHTPRPAVKNLAARLVTRIKARGVKLPAKGVLTAPVRSFRSYAAGKLSARGSARHSSSAKNTKNVHGVVALPIRERVKHAAHAVTAQIQKAAKKLPAKPSHPSDTKKALEVVAPIAQACQCAPEPVLAQVRANMRCGGYPNEAADSLLARIHEVAARVERAAVQRVATSEHNALKATDQFERQVLMRLANLASHLPPCHPSRVRAHRTLLQRMAV